MTVSGKKASAIDDARRFHVAGRLDEAERLYRAALKKDRKNADALYLLGSLVLQRDEAADAVKLLEAARRARPASYEILINLAIAHRMNSVPEQTAVYCRQAIALDPRRAEGFLNLGNALRDLNDYPAAAAAYRQYLELRHTDADGHAILGDTLRLAGADDEAMDSYETALSYDPQHVNAHLNIAGILQNRGLHHAGLVVLEAAQRAAPADAEVKKSIGVAQLMLGRLREGWINFEARFAGRTERIFRRPAPPAYWSGQPLKDKHLLIWTEQGVGEEILYAGLFGEAATLAAQCTIECSPRMAPIFQRSFPAAQVLARTEDDEAPSWPRGVDVQIAAASLGQYLRADLASFPAHTGYLKADPGKAIEMRNAYRERARGRRIVGISWRSRNVAMSQTKSLDLTELTDLAQVPGVMFVNLQYGDCSAELENARARGFDVVNDLQIDPLTNMDDFFAHVAAMDLVISTSNTTVHVAGAQNIPAWVLLPAAKASLWYWFLRRADSPWYPSVRLLRADHEPWTKWHAAHIAAELTTWVQT